jgi:hypothetical protein
MATLVNTGRAMITGLMAKVGSGNGAATPSYIGWGTGTTAESATQTALVTAASEARVNGTVTQQTTSVTNDTFQTVATITSASSQSISEAGVFDALTAGNMLLRGVFTAIPLAIGDSITLTAKVQLT